MSKFIPTWPNKLDSMPLLAQYLSAGSIYIWLPDTDRKDRLLVVQVMEDKTGVIDRSSGEHWYFEDDLVGVLRGPINLY